MSEAPNSNPSGDSLPDEPAPSVVLPGHWSLGRVCLAGFFAAHWIAVIAYAMPRDAEPASIPLGRWSAAAVDYKTELPVLDTHRGKDWLSVQPASPLFLYLSLSNQSQRWKMFTPRRKMAACMAVHYRNTDGSKHITRLADPERLNPLRLTRWRMMEWALMSNHGVQAHVPGCQRALVEHLKGQPYRRAVLRKHFRLVPVLHKEELQPGYELFKDSESWAEAVRDLEAQPLATLPNTPLRPLRQERKR